MNRLILFRLLVVSIVLGLSASPAPATHPFIDVQRDHYRILPRFSRLNLFDRPTPTDRTRIEHVLSGEYDLVRVDHGHGLPVRAHFDNAEIWAAPICEAACLAYVLDADKILNLERLTGEALPVLAPFDVFHFTGKMDNGSSVDLFAAVLGPWMYVRGQAEAPPDSPYFFAHDVQVHWLARSTPFADFNGDGVVDAADYVLLRKAETNGVGIGTDEDGTAGIGYEDWRTQFGETIPDLVAMDAALSAAAGAALAHSAVPEPTTALAAALGFLILALRGRRKAK